MQVGVVMNIPEQIAAIPDTPRNLLHWPCLLTDYTTRTLLHARVVTWLDANMGPMDLKYSQSRHLDECMVRRWVVDHTNYTDDVVRTNTNEEMTRCWQHLHGRAEQMLPDAEDIYYVTLALGNGWQLYEIAETREDKPPLLHIWVAFDDAIMGVQCKLAVS